MSSPDVSFYTEKGAWARAVVDRYEQHPGPGLLLSDIDDTSIDSKSAWRDHFVSLAVEHGRPDLASLRPADFAAGHRKHYEQLISPAKYDEIKAYYMNSAAFHAAMVAIENSALIDLGRSHNLPHGYITTRPEAIGAVTCQNLLDCGFAAAPTLLRAENVPYGNTIGYKIGGVTEVRAELDQRTRDGAPLYPDVPVYLMDDYTDLATRINTVDPGRIIGLPYVDESSWAPITELFSLPPTRELP